MAQARKPGAARTPAKKSSPAQAPAQKSSPAQTLASAPASSPPQAPAKKSVALIIGGGAPNATLMAGSLVAFIERKVKFELISTAGAGALVGLLYAAPKQGDAISALRGLVNTGVNDLINACFPVNYKVFQKPGQLADIWRQLCAQNPVLQSLQQLQDQGSVPQFMFDWISLMLATLCPSDLSSSSTGLCAHVPFIDSLVDFDALRKLPEQFYLNAYNLNQHQMACWDKQQITKDHFLAALSFPFIYPPYLLNGDYYIEGAAVDTLNFKSLYQHYASPLDSVVVFDVLGCEKIMHPPVDLYDAWLQSIIVPLTELARDDLKLFEALHNIDPSTGKARSQVLRVPYENFLTPEDFQQELSWSRSNLSRLYDVGYQAGHALCDSHAADLGI